MITLSAQDLLDIDNWLRQHAENLRLEAQDAQDEEDEEADGENFLYSQYI